MPLAPSPARPPASPPALPPGARAAVLAWFDARGRDLSFRASRDPYAILVSEVMAQQTQISRVVEAWGRFLERFPTVHALAAASPADVIRAWRGMGYDRRALNLRRAARMIVDEHGGRVPDDLAVLERLPGVGPYTARAVASIAFGRPSGAVDTNVRRVLGRALASAGDGTRPASWLQTAADASVDPGRPGDWTHAVMDIGATICRPVTPRCEDCPLRSWCAFAATATLAPAPRARSTARSPTVPFTSTSRWLRGRIVDRLRAAVDSTWTVVDAPIGPHDAVAIGRALIALARDGVAELDPEIPLCARLTSS
jgi:A/G-specific adenine glycosylase